MSIRRITNIWLRSAFLGVLGLASVTLGSCVGPDLEPPAIGTDGAAAPRAGSRAAAESDAGLPEGSTPTTASAGTSGSATIGDPTNPVLNAAGTGAVPPTDPGAAGSPTDAAEDAGIVDGGP